MQKFFHFLWTTVFIIFYTIGPVAAQQPSASGTVIDPTGNPLSGVSVILKGSHIGVTTDMQGRFQLSRLPQNATLIFSFIGFKTTEETACEGMYIVMQNEMINLGEVIIEGAYGRQRSKSVTGAISTVGPEVFSRRPITTALSGLEGMVTGVQVNDASGQPGISPTLNIRGFGSVNGSNTPLIVIDGAFYSTDITDLNPADIESISVLKDATSAALYGNRAANGVVLITTRKSTSRTLSFQVSTRQGIFVKGMREYEQMNADEFMETMWQGYRNALLTDSPERFPTLEAANTETNASLIKSMLGYNIYNAPDDELFDGNGKLKAGVSIQEGYREDLNWQKPLEHNGWRQEYYLSGGMNREKGNLTFSLGYLDEEGYTLAADLKRLTARVTAGITPRPWLKGGINLNATNQKQNYVLENTSNGQNNLFKSARLMAPIYPVHLHDMATGEYLLDKEGQQQYDDGNLYARPQNIGNNIVAIIQKNQQELEQISAQGQAWVEIDFLNDFAFTIRGTMNQSENRNKRFENSSIGQAVPYGGSMWQSNIGFKNITWQEQLTWNHQFGTHALDALISHENFRYDYDYTQMNKHGEIFPEIISLSNFTTLNSLDGYLSNYRTESYLGRLRYNYASRYFTEITFRRDGSSRFHPDHRWGNFWSIGGAWIVSDENFMRHQSWVDYLKFRISYGEVGNDQSVSYYAYMPLYTITSVGNHAASIKKSNPSANISWETSVTISTAIETQLFKRWNFILEYFDKQSKDLLFDVTLPLSTGAISNSNAETLAQETRNLGSASNRGIEFSTDVDIIRNRNWHWNMGLGITHIKNKILTLPKANRENGILAGNQKLMEGHSIYEWWLPQFAGIDQLTGNSLYEVDTESYTTGQETEDGKQLLPEAWRVQIGEKYYTTNTSYARKDWSGKALPLFYGHFSTTLSWRNFTFSALCTYSVGGKVYDNIYQDIMSVGNDPHALHRDLLKSWQQAPAGMSEDAPDRIDKKGIPVINSSLNIYNNALSSRFLRDASYFSIKNIALSYSLPTILAQKLDLEALDIQVSIDNAGIWTSRRGLNPQQSFDRTQNYKPVTSKIYSLGMTIKL